MRGNVKVTLYDGRVLEAAGEFSGTGDRLAFEETFGISAVVLQRMSASFDEDGELLAEADPSQIQEGWVAFLVWRMLRRAGQVPRDVPWREWFQDEVADIDLDLQGDVPRPTGPTPEAIRISSH
jgi:hypothetical protein